MPAIKRPLNKLGLWLSRELSERNILCKDFAERLGITPQYLAEIMRCPIGERCETHWKEEALKALLNGGANAES